MRARGRTVPDVKSRVTDEDLVRRRRRQIVGAAAALFAERGYYRTTTLDIARKAGISSGLIYQYVSDKDDVLLLVLLDVLESYDRQVPQALEGLSDPLKRWEAAVRAYCGVVDRRREATVLAYRSTNSLPPGRRGLVKQREIETNAYLADTLRDGIAAGMFRSVNVDVVTYQLVTFAHTWALKHWRLEELCTLEEYLEEGLDFFAHALLTPAGWRHYRPRRAPDAACGAGEGRARSRSSRTRRKPP